MLRKHRDYFFVSFLTLTTFAVLYTFRHVDDNRLTNWNWVFTDRDLTGFFFLLVFGIFISFMMSRLSFIERGTGLFLFILSFAACIFFWQVPELLVDASRYFTQAKHLEVHGISYFFREWGKDIHAWTDMPLIPFLYGLIFRFFGESRIFLQIFNTSLFSLTVVVTYLTGKTLWNRETGFFAGVLITGMPYIFSQVPLMLVDVSTMFFLTLSVFTFIRALEHGGIWIPFSAIAIFCALFSKYSTWLMLTVLPVICMVYLIEGQWAMGKRGHDPRPAHDVRRPTVVISRTIAVALISGVCIGLIVYLKFDVISVQVRFLNEYQRPGLGRWGESFISTFFYQVHPFITLTTLYSIYCAVSKKDLKFVITGWMLLLVFLLQIRRARYILILFPMVALMASYGLQMIRTPEIRRFIAYCAVISSLVISLFAYLPFLQSMSLINLKHAGEYLNTTDTYKAEVYTLPSNITVVNPAVAVPILDLFTEKQIIYHHDPDFSIPFEKIEKSSLRFTWEYENPVYYSPATETGGNAVIIISNNELMIIPEDIKGKLTEYEKAAIFRNSTGIFRYHPVVTVFMPAEINRN